MSLKDAVINNPRVAAAVATGAAFVYAATGSPRVAAAVATATTSTGLGAVFEWIPADVGKLATVVGIVLSCVLIYTHMRRGHSQYRKTLLEIQLLKTQIRKNEEPDDGE